MATVVINNSFQWLYKIYHARIGAFADYTVDVGEELAELRDCRYAQRRTCNLLDEQRLCHGYECGFLLRHIQIVDECLFELRRQQAAAECGFVVALARDEQRSHTI